MLNHFLKIQLKLILMANINLIIYTTHQLIKSYINNIKNEFEK